MVVRVHASHAEYLIKHVRQGSHSPTHIYFFDSLSTTMREFRTIKCCEFYKYAAFILQPNLQKVKESPASEGMMAFVE